MVSPRRRQVIIAGVGTLTLPAVPFVGTGEDLPDGPLVLSGRVTGADGKALSGATVALGPQEAVTDADGRFALVGSIPAPGYRVRCNGRAITGTVSGARRDDEGTWRATLSVRVA